MTTNTKASTTIQPLREVLRSESYKFNKLQNFDGTSHGTFVLPHWTIDGITGQHQRLKNKQKL